METINLAILLTSLAFILFIIIASRIEIPKKISDMLGTAIVFLLSFLITFKLAFYMFGV